MPEKLGGAELDPVHSLEVLENLSYGDASAGWVTMAANLSIGTAGAYLSDMAVAELWGDGKQPVIAGQGTRPGTAKMVNGGLLAQRFVELRLRPEALLARPLPRHHRGDG